MFKRLFNKNNMQKILFTLSLSLFFFSAHAEDRTIDISGDNTSTSYKSYSTAISLPAQDVVNVMMARYCYFSSKITGSGVLNLYGGGDRCFLGNADKKWPEWTGYTGDIHVHPFRDNSSSAGFWGIVLAHGGKASSPENALDDVKGGKVNPSMANNRVTLHEGATMCGEANSNGSGFRIGELNMEAGSTLYGWYKKNRSVYYLLGGLNTDFTMAGTIQPVDYNDGTLLSIVKEGTGTLSITGNDNYVSGGLRILEGRVNIMNDCEEAENQKLRGALGAKPNASDAIAYVFGKGVLGGTGNIGGTVENYGTIEPGADGIGRMRLKNYAEEKDANLVVHPASVLRFKVSSEGNSNLLNVDGEVQYSNITEDFQTSDKMPVIELVVADDANLKVGDYFSVMACRAKSGDDWNFAVRANKYTWEIDIAEASGFPSATYFDARIVSLETPDDPDNPDNPDKPDDIMGAFYDDGIDDATDDNPLRYYADKNQKNIGVALATYKGYQSDRDEAGRQFNMMVCENEMKMETLQPSKGSFSFGSADQLVSFAQKNDMAIRGHCLVWHSQQPTWLSSDGKKNDKGWTRDEALELMKNHITKVMQHYKG